MHFQKGLKRNRDCHSKFTKNVDIIVFKILVEKLSKGKKSR